MLNKPSVFESLKFYCLSQFDLLFLSVRILHSSYGFCRKTVSLLGHEVVLVTGTTIFYKHSQALCQMFSNIFYSSTPGS